MIKKEIREIEHINEMIKHLEKQLIRLPEELAFWNEKFQNLTKKRYRPFVSGEDARGA